MEVSPPVANLEEEKKEVVEGEEAEDVVKPLY